MEIMKKVLADILEEEKNKGAEGMADSDDELLQIVQRDIKLQNLLTNICNEYGMRKILEQLISIPQLNGDEDYILTLREDLGKTYDNYMLRYNLYRFKEE